MLFYSLYIAHNANKFALFTLVHADSFEAALQALEQIDSPAAGSLEDALQFFDADIALWRETDRALEWVRATAARLRLTPPTRAEATATVAASSTIDLSLLAHTTPSESINSSSSSGSTEVSVDTHAMFLEMYFTALAMAQE